MKKVMLYTAVSIDGFIATEDGGIDWLNDPEYDIPGEDYGYGEFCASVDTTLMGNNTYRQVLGFGEPWPYPDYRNIVFSRQDKEPDEHVEFHSGDIAAFVKKLKKESGKNIWLVGGGQLNGKLLDAGLIDQMRLTVIPVTLGKGIPLFKGTGSVAKWHLADCNYYVNGMVQLTYDKNPPD